VANVSERHAPLSITTSAQFPAATISFNLSPGYSLAPAAVTAIEKQARPRRAPANVLTASRGRAAFSGLPTNTLLSDHRGGSHEYIVLGVLYESYIAPDHDPLQLPSAGVGALLALPARGH